MTKFHIVTGLGWGDEGKGALVDHLASQRPSFVVKSSGGAQCAHNVMAGSTHQTCSQFGAGVLSNSPTYLGKHFIMNPLNLWREMECAQKLAPMYAHPMTRVTTPYHVAANRAREIARGDDRHGSCGEGIGEAVADSLDTDKPVMIRACMLKQRGLVRSLLMAWRREKAKVIDGLGLEVPSFFLKDDYLDDVVEQYATCPVQIHDNTFVNFWINNQSINCGVIYENGQGTLLDEHVGFHPHTTWSHVTPAHAWGTIEDHGRRVDDEIVTSWGVMRAYMTRHGAGPFPTEDDSLKYPELNNGWGKFQGGFRLGHLDMMMIEYSAKITGVSAIALNHLDLVPQKVTVCVGYQEMDEIPVVSPFDFDARERLTKRLFDVTPEYITIDRSHLPDFVEDWLKIPVRVTAFGPHRDSRRKRYVNPCPNPLKSGWARDIAALRRSPATVAP